MKILAFTDIHDSFSALKKIEHNIKMKPIIYLKCNTKVVFQRIMDLTLKL